MSALACESCGSIHWWIADLPYKKDTRTRTFIRRCKQCQAYGPDLTEERDPKGKSWRGSGAPTPLPPPAPPAPPSSTPAPVLKEDAPPMVTFTPTPVTTEPTIEQAIDAAIRAKVHGAGEPTWTTMALNELNEKIALVMKVDDVRRAAEKLHAGLALMGFGLDPLPWKDRVVSLDEGAA